MMRLFLAMALFLNYIHVFSQEKRVNFIISIDEKIVGVDNPRIILNDRYGNSKKIKINYIPGEISMDTLDYETAISNNVESLLFEFTYAETCGNNVKYYNYDIDFDRNWLVQPYFVIYIYNTDKRKYKNIYEPLPEKSYNFEYQYSSFGMKLLQKKMKKEQKKCLTN